MATFFEELWNSVFTPGTTPTLLVATNASFGALQFLLLILLLATYSVHFLVLSVLSASLWYAINWFARELQIEQAKSATKEEQRGNREKSTDPGSDTETEMPVPEMTAKSTTATQHSTSSHLQPDPALESDNLRRRRSLGDHSSSGYVSTDSEWEKVSEGENKQ
ncbi:SMK killer toxin resistance protein [Lithohypha guttulata]|uniref:SMK killer toxin resistance protein n=1 Tax=Lithohypha guttulata TaxID=1690604 RepID=UPI002DE0A6DB|nr:SMK killer toxin resistance protein [Lithohypha guttulata]KAK5098443.1 SMK killer toxin resistance protein [Lithohypha guttulata]